jgi:transcriptional regulator with PAS, ATPase and Fis domain
MVEKIGGTFPVKVDVRIIAATNRNLEEMVSTGKFRQDLYYRLNVIPIQMPALRERIEDVPELFRHFMDQYSKKTGLTPKKLSPEVERLFINYSWPGNVRELRNAVEYLIQVSTDEFIKISDLTQLLKNFYCDTVNTGASEEPALKEMDRLERDAIREALEKYGLSVEGKKKAAKYLGLSLSTLYRRLALYDLKYFRPDHFKNSISPY